MSRTSKHIVTGDESAYGLGSAVAAVGRMNLDDGCVVHSIDGGRRTDMC